MTTFRVALSADFLKPDGSPAFADFDLTPLHADPRIEIGYVRCGRTTSSRPRRSKTMTR